MEISALHWRQRKPADVRHRTLQASALASCSALFLFGCSTGPAPLSIVLVHPQTKQSLTCAAKDQLGRTDESVLAAVVENCARDLETRGFVRQR